MPPSTASGRSPSNRASVARISAARSARSCSSAHMPSDWVTFGATAQNSTGFRITASRNPKGVTACNPNRTGASIGIQLLGEGRSRVSTVRNRFESSPLRPVGTLKPPVADTCGNPFPYARGDPTLRPPTTFPVAFASVPVGPKPRPLYQPPPN